MPLPIHLALRRAPLSTFAVPLAVLLLLAGTPFAAAATISIPDALTGSLQEIITTAVTGLIAALIGWVAIVVKNKFNIDIEAKHREALTAFLTRQASGLVAMGAVNLNGVRIEVQNETLAQAANAALVAIPDALNFFGLTPQKIAGMIVDMLPAQPTVSAAQAVALDIANPATPSTGPA
ncbi:MAG: hypothetical protein ACOY6K_10010 [Pseudomonadota bacterium]